MTEPRDKIDDWLDREVTPLYPRPGSLDRIRRHARQRKRRQAVVTAAGCAVVLAAAVSVPQFLGHQPAAPDGSVAASQRPPTAGPAGSPGGAVSPRPRGSGSLQQRQQQQHSSLSGTTSGAPAPAHFRPTSVTVVGVGTDASPAYVGAVIGQAGPPCATRYCTSLAGTSTYGISWYGVSAPLAGPADGPAGVSQLRFANLLDGWAFGPQLWETAGGGWPWEPVQTNGMRVTDLEAAGQTALAVFARCAGSGSDYAGDCTTFALYTGAAGSTQWTPVPVPPAFRTMTSSQPSSASLVLARGRGYLLTPSGVVLTGSVTGGAWTEAGQAPCRPGQAQPSGQPADAQIAASPSQLLLACDGQAGAVASITLYTSAHGSRWQVAGPVQASGAATSLASASPSGVVLATTAGLYYSANDGRTWLPAALSGAAPAGGFSYVGMTSKTQGVAVPADARLGKIYISTDGGRTWTPSVISRAG